MGSRGGTSSGIAPARRAAWSAAGEAERSVAKQPSGRASARPGHEAAGGDDAGAYLLYLNLSSRLTLEAGSLGTIELAPGRYAYVGGARRSIAARVARHCRLARAKSGRPHWHVDYLLVHPAVRLAEVVVYERVAECALARRLACRRGVSVAVPHFGASDCRSGCRTHLYRLAAGKA